MNHCLLFFLTLLLSCDLKTEAVTDTTFCTHSVVLDKQKKIITWYTPGERAYDHFLRLQWDFVKNHIPNSPGPLPRSCYPQYYFYCAFKPVNGILEPDTWMNDIGEKIPNWFENTRLNYAYTGDSSVMKIICDFIDYTLVHGTSSPDYAWPDFPYTTTNAGDTLFRGFTSGKRFVLDEIQVDHAGEMGLTYYRMYCYTNDIKYLTAAINVADVLAKNAHTGNKDVSVWPYRVVMTDGRVTAPYGANWTEDNFIFRTAPGEPSTMWGANIVGEQDSFNYKMEYQTARYAAECARWYAESGDESYKEKAYRSINWVTYCNDSTGMAFESPVSKGILSWWSDCYGECPRMFYYAFAAIPEWAPPHENHILYSEGVLRDVKYTTEMVKYSLNPNSLYLIL